MFSKSCIISVLILSLNREAQLSGGLGSCSCVWGLFCFCENRRKCSKFLCVWVFMILAKRRNAIRNFGFMIHTLHLIHRMFENGLKSILTELQSIQRIRTMFLKRNFCNHRQHKGQMKSIIQLCSRIGKTKCWGYKGVF